jgi:hypothetical protein
VESIFSGTPRLFTVTQRTRLNFDASDVEIANLTHHPMKTLKTLITGDLHLTTNPVDGYRWDIFPWLERQITNREISHLLILGDLTERKDEHPARLVHRLVRRLRILAKLCPIDILKGNHDYIDEATPFFGFLSGLRGITFHTKPAEKKIGGMNCLFLPHVRKWKTYREYDLKKYRRVFIHQAIEGAVGSNGHAVEGVPTRAFKDAHCVIAGDIHKPQTLLRGKFIYVGSPHPVNFGDDFKPRVLIDRGHIIDPLPRVSIRKMVLHLTDPKEIRSSGLTRGDRAKVTLHLPRSEFIHWETHRAYLKDTAEEMGVELHDVKLAEIPSTGLVRRSTVPTSTDRAEVFSRFCRRRNLVGGLVAVGSDLLEV